MIKEKNKKSRNTEIKMVNNPKSSFSEAIRAIRTNIEFSSVDKKIKTIIITSPAPGDGKSFISANLAISYAMENRKVLLIDCDLRRGRQDKIFGVKKDNTKGYSNLILNYSKLLNSSDSGESTAISKKNIFSDYIEKTGHKNLFLLPNGVTPPNPIELLSSRKNEVLLNDLKDKFDIIILDCPPVLGLADTLVLTKYSDANIVTITSERTRLETLREVKKSIEKVNSSITGIIVNKTKKKSSSYYGYYGYY